MADIKDNGLSDGIHHRLIHAKLDPVGHATFQLGLHKAGSVISVPPGRMMG